MRRYEIVQIVEMSIKHIVRAENAERANEIATERTASACKAIANSRKGVNFGDISDDYIPASDD